MKRLLIISILILAVLQACQQKKSGKESEETSRNLNKLFDEYYEGYMELNPVGYRVW